jgi:nitroreductase
MQSSTTPKTSEMEFIKKQEWRYATKKFDPHQKVSEENLEIIKRAVQLSTSSYGLQLYKVLIIEDPKTREKLLPASWNQSQIVDASHLFVFCNYAEVKPHHIDQYIDLTAKTRQLNVEDLKAYGDFMKLKIGEQSNENQASWTKHQTYLALGNLLAVCADLQIDACPMEGFEAEKYNEILGLTEKGLNASLVAPIGYRSQDDNTQNLPKVRKPLELLFESI